MGENVYGKESSLCAKHGRTAYTSLWETELDHREMDSDFVEIEPERCGDRARKILKERESTSNTSQDVPW